MRFLLSILFTLIFTAYFQNLRGQNIELNVKKQPLSEVLLNLSSRSGINLSFDNDMVSKYIVSGHKRFSNFDEALTFLLKRIPLNYGFENNVYLIFPSPEKKISQLDSLFFSGTIFDQSNYEPLPHSLLCINNKYIYSDARGYFSYSEDFTDSLKIAISYIGYGSIDTIIPTSSRFNKQEFFLQPNTYKIQEITINKPLFIDQPIIGRETGKIKLNSEVANYIPGVGDNSLFQFLTLMPGISQLSGNNSGISICGGSPENILIEFDGIRLFNTNHFYGNIGMINPLSIKDIEVFKGSTSADFTGSESGVIKITGKNGNRISPSLTAEINNLTLNALFETPAGIHNTLLFAIRGIYRKPENTIFFKQKSSTIYLPESNQKLPIPENKIKSDYFFGDVQLKFSGSGGDKNSYYLNLYQSYDLLSYITDSSEVYTPIANNIKQRWGNSGIAFYYNQNWHENLSSDIKVGLSSNFETTDNFTIFQKQNDQTVSKNKYITGNQLWDFSIKNSNTLINKRNHLQKFGIGVDFYQIDQIFNINDSISNSIDSHSLIPFLFFQDKFNLGKFFVFDAGLRSDYSSVSNEFYFSPNISIMAIISKSFSAGFSAGQNHQFISKIPIVFADYTNKSFLTLADGKRMPISKSNQISASINYINPNYQLTIETYLKSNLNISEYVPEKIDSYFLKLEKGITKNISTGYYIGKGYSKGVSIYNQVKFKMVSLLISYSLNESMRKIPDLYGNKYIPSLNNYKHEIKTAAIFQFWKFNLSASYVFCSGRSQFGFNENIHIDNWDTPEQKPYSRFDIGLNFKSNFKKIDLETGCSVLNILNNKNLNYFNMRPTSPGINSTNSDDLFFEINSLPRSVCLFLKIKL